MEKKFLNSRSLLIKYESAVWGDCKNGNMSVKYKSLLSHRLSLISAFKQQSSTNVNQATYNHLFFILLLVYFYLVLACLENAELSIEHLLGT